RVVKVLISIIDPRQTRPFQELVAQHFIPDLPHLPPFGKEAVATDVEKIALVIDRPGDTADDVIGFENYRRDVVAGKFIGGSEPGRSAADDDHGFVGHVGTSHDDADAATW